MCSAFLRAGLVLVLLASPAAARELRVCADPNNLPYSNERREGFENRIVEILARELGATVTYSWWAQRRGYVRNTIKARVCDLLPGTTPHLQGLRTTNPYYRSTYVFVTREGEPAIASFNDARLRTLKVGVHLIGDDGANTPPAHELASRGIVENVRGYSLYGDYSQPNPPARILEAIAAAEIDVAIVWGPLAGYFARRGSAPLVLTAVEPEGAASGLPMTFDIAMGLRRDDPALGAEVEAALQHRAAEIKAVLAEYGVPLVERPAEQGGPR